MAIETVRVYWTGVVPDTPVSGIFFCHEPQMYNARPKRERRIASYNNRFQAL